MKPRNRAAFGTQHPGTSIQDPRIQSQEQSVKNQLPDEGRIGSVALRPPRAAILWAVLAQLVITAAKFNKRFIILQQQQQPRKQQQSCKVTHTRRKLGNTYWFIGLHVITIKHCITFITFLSYLYIISRLVQVFFKICFLMRNIIIPFYHHIYHSQNKF